MGREIQPIEAFARRMPEAGRLRFGVKSDKGAPKAIDTWRITSQDREALELLAAKYGGAVKQWSPSKGRSEWEVITTSSEIDVVVPPNALGDTPIYEAWSGGGLLRRCDGLRCLSPVKTGGGVELAEGPCACDQKGVFICKPVTRVNLLLPDVPFNGTWRLEAKGWNAAQELPGMMEMVAGLTGRHLIRARLVLEKRTSVSGGQTHHFVVPAIRVPTSLDQMVEGGATLQAINAPDAKPPSLMPPPTDDDEIADAEIVDDTTAEEAEMKQIQRLSLELGLSTPDVEGFCFVVSDGQQSALKWLTLVELRRISSVMEKLKTGKLVYQGLDGRRAVVARPQEVA